MMRAATRPGTRSAGGFTLLEVMVAIGLLALGLVVLLQVQARSIQLAQQARNMSVATGLARGLPDRELRDEFGALAGRLGSDPLGAYR